MEESWEESTVYEEMVDRKFLWSVFKDNGEDFVFYGARFWRLPSQDESIVKEGWDDIREIIRDGVVFVKDRKDDGTFILTKRGKNNRLTNIADTTKRIKKTTRKYTTVELFVIIDKAKC